MIGCPGPIIIDLDRGLTQFPAQWIAPTGTDNSNLPVTVELNGPSSGSLFSIGETLITYVITDTVGLQSLCVFTVTVNGKLVFQTFSCLFSYFNVNFLFHDVFHIESTCHIRNAYSRLIAYSR